jgi:PKD repeat protein
MTRLVTVAAVAFAAACASSACTVHQTEAPPLTGPSEFALSVGMQAIPDAIGFDGGSQSAVKIVARGPDGRAINALPFRVDMIVDGVPQDFGSLSARSVVTGSDGTATIVYTAPPAPVGGNGGTCNGLPGTCVTIVATPTSTNFVTVTPQTVVIRLVPLGVILPPAGTPTAAFTFTPSPINVLVPTTFDATSSTPGAGASQITSYAWSFGDGSTGTGATVSHTFSTNGTFNVTLTVTNDRGLSASTTQAVTAASSDPFTGDWVFSPAAPVVNSPVLFNADQVQTSPGHTVTTFNWNFGDGGTGSGFVVNHTYTAPGVYNVVLSVTDDLGRKKVFTAKGVTVTSGAPTANITFSPSSPHVGTQVNFDASSTTTTGGATIVGWAWSFGDGTSASTGPQVAHTFAAAATYVVRVTVTDSAGRTATATANVTVSP